MIPKNTKVSVSNLKNNLTIGIRQSAIKDISTQDNTVEFRGVIFRFAWNGWNFLNGVSRGKIRIDYESAKTKYGSGWLVISYKLWCKEFFFIALVFSIIPLALFNTIFFLPLLAIIWLVFVLGNYLLSAHRFKSFIINSLHGIYFDHLEKISTKTHLNT